MNNRIDEIRARLDAATPGTTRGIDDRRPRYNEIAIRTRTGDVIAELPGDGMADALFIAHAPADIAWLLDALADEQRHSEMLIERIDQLHLEITKLRFGKPERDVAYDVTMRRGSVGGYTGPQADGPPAPALPPVGVEVVNPFTGERIVREDDEALRDDSRLVVKSPQERVWEVWRTTRDEKVATFRTKREATAYIEGGGDA